MKENDLRQLTDSQAWKEIKSFLVRQCNSLRDIDFPSTLTTEQLKLIEISKDPIRTAQMLAYKVVSDMLSKFVKMEDTIERDVSKDSFA